ncbi:hypothetical protein EYV94_28510, partial [Puteibacter caeruleilacunae]
MLKVPTVVLKAGDVEKSISVSQGGVSVSVSDYLTVSTTSISSLNSPVNVIVSSNICWTVTIDQMSTPWVLLQDTSGNNVSSACGDKTTYLDEFAQHNGNISGIRWRNNDTKRAGYAFRYDGLNRLTKADYGRTYSSGNLSNYS